MWGLRGFAEVSLRNVVDVGDLAREVVNNRDDCGGDGYGGESVKRVHSSTPISSRSARVVVAVSAPARNTTMATKRNAERRIMGFWAQW